MPGSENLLHHPAITERLFRPRCTGMLPTFVVGAGELPLGCHAIRVDPGRADVRRACPFLPT